MNWKLRTFCMNWLIMQAIVTMSEKQLLTIYHSFWPHKIIYNVHIMHFQLKLLRMILRSLPEKSLGSYWLYWRAFKVQYLYRFLPHPPCFCQYIVVQGHAYKLVQFQASILYLMLVDALHVLHVLHIEEMPVKTNTRILFERALP